MLSKINWEEVPVEVVNPSMSRQIVAGEKIMIVRMEFKDGFIVPLHHHVNEQITQVISGTIRFWFGEDESQEMDIHAGEVVVIPSDLPHKALIIGDVVAVDTWAPPRQDWLDGTDTYLR